MCNDKERLTVLDMLLEEKGESLSNQGRKVADYCQTHKNEIINQSVAEISDICGVSQATVVRFCKTLGFNGLKEFKIAVGGPYRSPQNSDTPILWEDSSQEIFKKAYLKVMAELEISFKENNATLFSKCGEIIAAAEEIIVVGIGGSATVANYFKTEFMRLGKRIEAYTDQYSISHLGYFNRPGQVMIAVSCSGETEELVKLAAFKKETGTEVLAFTAAAGSRLANLADYTILSQRSPVFCDDHDSYGRIAQITLITTLYLFTAITMGKADSNFKDHYTEKTNYRQLPEKDK